MAEGFNRTDPESRSNEQKMHRASFFQGRLRRLFAKAGAFASAFGLLLASLLLTGLPGPAQGPEHANLTDAEKTWLESNPQKLLLYFNTEFPPIEFISESGDFIGLGADVLAAIEKLLGVSFRAIPSDNWNTHLAALKNGTCPIAPTIVRTEEREEFAFFTQPYATVPVVVITAETASDVVSLNNYKGKKVGVVSGYATENYLRDLSLVGLFEVVPVSSVARGLQMVSFGEIDAFAENLAVAAYYIEKLGIPNLRVADTTDYSFAFSIGVSREYPLLYSAIEKALALIPEKDLLQIRRKWIMLETDFGIDPETLRLVQIAAVFAVLLAGGLAVITFFLKKRLNQKVKRIRQSEMRAKRQRSAIVSLALDKDIVNGDPDRALNRMAKTLGRTLNVARAGIWVLSEDGGEMRCPALWERHPSQERTPRSALSTAAFPRYLEWIRKQGGISAREAQKDERTSELVVDYLRPQGITSLLDSGVLLEGRLVGIVCLEHTGDLRNWEADEEAFARTAAALVGQIMTNAKRKEAEQKLQESNRQLQSLSDNLPNGYVYQAAVEPGMQAPVFLYLSAGVERIHGLSPQAIMNDPGLLYSQILEDDRQHVFELEDAARKTLSLFQVETRYRHPSGETRWLSMTSSPRLLSDGRIIWEGIAMDITGRKRMEEERERLQGQLLQAHKMESVGILAGGIAHDFNNLLHAMSGNIDLLLRNKPPEHPEAGRLTNVLKSLNRAKSLVQQILLFSRKIQPRKILVDMNREVRETVQILERTIPKMIALEVHLEPSPRPVISDPVQVEQVLLNLAGNAVDAMPDGGRLVIETSNISLDEHFVRLHPEASTGRHVLLTVTDTGTGMDKETMKHLFDPFFTTKEVGKGTGLGLASVYGVIKEHGGYIRCLSEPGKGSSFHVYWPATDQENDLVNSTEKKSAAHQGGNETLLVVDDEEEIRELTQEYLESLGYAVKTAENGEEALRIYGSEDENIRLVLLDLNMPGMGGVKCLEKLRKLDPRARVLIASGCTSREHRAQSLASGAGGFIAKPFQMRELAEKIRKMLNAK